MILTQTKKGGLNIQAFNVLAVAFFFVAGTYGVKGIANFLGLGAREETFSLLIYLLWAVVYIKYLWNNMHMVIDLIIFETIYISLLYLNYKAFPYTREYYEEAIMFIRQIVVVFIPAMTVAYRINNFTSSIRQFRKIGIIGISFMVLCYFMGYIERWDYQSFGTHLCPFVLMVFASYIYTKNQYDVIWLIIGFIFIMAGGRQSFVGVLLGFIIIYFSNKVVKLTLKKFISLFLGGVIGLIILYLFLPLLLMLLGDLLSSIGIESRTFDMLNSNELTSTSTRESIYSLSLMFINSNMYEIKGLFADRDMLRSVSDWMAYPHNLILELMMDFGAVLGAIISGIILFLFGWRLLHSNMEKKLIIGIIGSAVLTRLMVSSSFVIEGPFYLMLGLFLNNKDEF